MASLKPFVTLLGQPILSCSLQRQAFAITKFTATQIPKTAILGIRQYSSRQQQHGDRMILLRDYGVFATYIPPETSPALTDFKNWRLTKWRNLKNSVQNFLCVGLIKYKSEYEKWNSAKFLAEAHETYKDMNEAFARGNRDILEEVCLDSMYSNLKNQLKSRGNNVRWEWKYHGDVEQPRIVCVRLVGNSGLSKGGFAVGQVAVRMFTKQSMAVFDNKKNKLIGGDPSKIHNVLEYVVFQKTISDPEDIWRIYGKIASPEKLKQKAQELS